MNHIFKCENCKGPIKIIGVYMVELKHKDGSVYQRYWEIIGQCPKCKSAQTDQWDLVC